MSAQNSPSRQPGDQSHRARLAESLVRTETFRLSGVARRHGTPRDEIEDVIQSSLADFLRSFPGPYDQAHALSYLFRCVQNRALKYHRWHARRQAPLVNAREGDENAYADQVDTVAAGPANVLERVIEREDYRGEVGRLLDLPQELREVVALRGLGYSPAEIAGLTGVSHRAVRKRIERANRLLAQSA
jgi:RNA polymerase sigma factor (sigma-70 family)